MKIRITFEFDEIERLAIAHSEGDDKPASRETIRDIIILAVNTTIEDLLHDYSISSVQKPADVPNPR